MKSIFIILCTFLFASTSFGTTKPEALGSSSIGLLEKTIEVQAGYGEGHFYENAENLEQELVNQGFAMLNLFQYTDAFRSFQTALSVNSNLHIASIGRAFSAMSLDRQNSYYLNDALETLKSLSSSLDEKTRNWGNVLSSILNGEDLNGNALTSQQAYLNLKVADSNALEALTFGNWVTNSYNLPDFEKALDLDPNNAGALHYSLHMAESQNDHHKALAYGERLIVIATESAHAQHMYGHVLPHFNRWNEADKQFEIADKLHNDWAVKNEVSPTEDWHYYHNLDLWSVSKMVVDPNKALEVLNEIQALNLYGLLDYVDYASAVLPLESKDQIEGLLTQVESQSQELNEFLLSSRLLFEMIFNPGQETFESVISALQAPGNFKNKRLLYNTMTLISLKNNNQSEYEQSIVNLIDELKRNFERGGFDGWKTSVLESKIYERLFQIYGLVEASKALEINIKNQFMNPVD